MSRTDEAHDGRHDSGASGNSWTDGHPPSWKWTYPTFDGTWPSTRGPACESRLTFLEEPSKLRAEVIQQRGPMAVGSSTNCRASGRPTVCDDGGGVAARRLRRRAVRWPPPATTPSMRTPPRTTSRSGTSPAWRRSPSARSRIRACWSCRATSEGRPASQSRRPSRPSRDILACIRDDVAPARDEAHPLRMSI
jgi:hypothetical protein